MLEFWLLFSLEFKNTHGTFFLVHDGFAGFSLTAQKTELGDLLLGSFSLVSLTSISSAVIFCYFKIISFINTTALF